MTWNIIIMHCLQTRLSYDYNARRRSVPGNKSRHFLPY